MARLSYEYVKSEIEKRGGELLSEEYINDRTKLIVKCKEGHVWNPMFQSIRVGKWCYYCAIKNKKIKIDSNELEEVYNSTNSCSKTAEHFGVSIGTIHRHLVKHNINKPVIK